MQIRSIGHASVVFDIAGTRILCDPWWNGPAYTGQWVQYPPPRVEPGDTERADFVYVSHGHEDHLHVPTLRTLDKRAVLLVPRLRDTGMRDFLRSMGFRQVLELGHAQRRRIAPGLHATMYVNKDDSILVLEGEGRTIVNANDALHACSRHVIDHFCDQIRARHGRIDALLCGWAGASWFPNCIQLTDDVGYDAVAREQVLVENFAYVARRLEPRMALPLGGAHALLDERLRWAFLARYRCTSPADELRRQGAGSIRTHELLPGDRVLDDQIFPAGGMRPSAGQAAADVQRLFSLDISRLRERHAPDPARLQRLLRALQANAAARAHRVLQPDESLRCRIDVRDVPEVSFLLDCDDRDARVAPCDRLHLAPLVLSTRLEVLEALAMQDFGYESIAHGCGAILQLRRRDLHRRHALLLVLGRKPLPANRVESLLAWLRSPRRSFQVWRDELHWRRLGLRLRRGEVERTNDIFAADPDRWSPLRAAPLPAPVVSGALLDRLVAGS